jgi:hypothetical protein
MIFNQSMQNLAQFMEANAIFIILAIAVVVLIAYLSRKKIKSFWLNYKTSRCLKRLGIDQTSNIKWPDGLGHYFVIDRLILRKDGISVLNYNRYPGKIFCADAIDEWTQMIGQKSYRFKNPLHELDLQIKAISASVPDVPVDGFLFFDHLAEFPKGHPDRVIHPKKIPGVLISEKKDEADAAVRAAWDELMTKVKSDMPGVASV